MHKIYKGICRSSYKIKKVPEYTKINRQFSQHDDLNWEDEEHYKSSRLLKKDMKKKSPGSIKFLNKKAENYYKLGLMQCFNLAQDTLNKYKKIAYEPETFKKISNTEYEIKLKTGDIMNGNHFENKEAADIIKDSQPKFINSKRSRIRYRISGSNTNDIHAKCVFDDIKRIKIDNQLKSSEANLDLVKENDSIEDITEEIQSNFLKKVANDKTKMSLKKVSEYIERNQDILAKNYVIRKTLTSFADDIKKKENLLEQLKRKTLRMSLNYDKTRYNNFTMNQSDLIQPTVEKKRKKQEDVELENVTYENPDIQLEDTFIYNADYSIPFAKKPSRTRFEVASPVDRKINKENEIEMKINHDKYDDDSKIIKPSESTGNLIKKHETNSLSLEDPDLVSFQRAEETVRKISEWEPQQLIKKINRKRSVISENAIKREDPLRKALFNFIVHYCGNKIVVLNNIIKQMLYRNNYKQIVDKSTSVDKNKNVLFTLSLQKLRNVKENHNTKKFIRIFRYPFPKDTKIDKRKQNLRLDGIEESDDRFSQYEITQKDKYSLEDDATINKKSNNKLILLENFNKNSKLNQDRLEEYAEKIRAVLMLDKQIKKLIENNRITEKGIPISRLNKKLIMKRRKIVQNRNSEEFKTESLSKLMLRTRASFKLVEKSITEKDFSAQPVKNATNNYSKLPKRKLISIHDLIKDKSNVNDKISSSEKRVKIKITLNEKPHTKCKKTVILNSNLLLEKKSKNESTKYELMNKINKELYGKRKLSLDHDKKISFVNIRRLWIIQKSKKNSIPNHERNITNISYKDLKKANENNSRNDSKQTKLTYLLLSANEKYEVDKCKNLKLDTINKKVTKNNACCENANIRLEIDIKKDKSNDKTLKNIKKTNDSNLKLCSNGSIHDSAYKESDSCQLDENEECDNDFDIVEEVPSAFPDINNQRERFDDFYKSPEYYSYNKWSYYEIYEYLKKFRVPSESLLLEKY